MELTDNILIFKTNIRSEFEKHHAKNVLDAITSIEEWSVDSEDVDCVLRVVSNTKDAEEIINKLTKAGYECSELE